MSLSVLREIRHKRITYTPETFPRVEYIQAHLGKHLQDREIYGKNYKAILQDPLIIICSSSGSLDKSNIIGDIITESLHEPGSNSYVELDDKVPLVVICIFECTVDGCLTNEDRKLLNSVRGLPKGLVEHMVYVTDQPQIPYSSLSEEIQFLLGKSATNSVFHSIFSPESANLAIRLSLYLEKNICNLIPLARNEIDDLYKGVQKSGKTLTSDDYEKSYAHRLRAGPFEDGNCLDILRSAAVERVCISSPNRYTRNKWIADEIRHKLEKSICEEFGKNITQTLFDKYESDVKESDLAVANIILDRIVLSDVYQVIYDDVLKTLVFWIVDAIKTVLVIALTFLVPVDLNCSLFRHSIAEKVHVQIMKEKEEIIKRILKKFKDVHVEKIGKALDQINKFKTTINESYENNLRMKCLYHELRIACKRNRCIRAFGYDYGKMCVFVRDVEKDAMGVRRFLSVYFEDDIEIRQFKRIKLPITQQFVYQSGDQVNFSDLQTGHQNIKLRDEYCECSGNQSKPFFDTSFHVTNGERDGNILFSHVTNGERDGNMRLHLHNEPRHRSDRIMTSPNTRNDNRLLQRLRHRSDRIMTSPNTRDDNILLQRLRHRSNRMITSSNIGDDNIFVHSNNGARHRTERLMTSSNIKEDNILIHSNNGPRCRSDRIIKPSNIIDVSNVSLHNVRMSQCGSIKKDISNKDNSHVEGKLFEKDSYLTQIETEVFMSGATRKISLGKYIGTFEETNNSDIDPHFYITVKDHLQDPEISVFEFGLNGIVAEQISIKG